MTRQEEKEERQQHGQPSQTVGALVAQRLREDPQYNEEAQLEQVVASSLMCQSDDPQVQEAINASLRTEQPRPLEDEQRLVEEMCQRSAMEFFEQDRVARAAHSQSMLTPAEEVIADIQNALPESRKEHGLVPLDAGAAGASTTSTATASRLQPTAESALHPSPPPTTTAPASSVRHDDMSRMTEEEMVERALAMSLQTEQARPPALPVTWHNNTPWDDAVQDGLNEDASLAEMIAASLKTHEEEERSRQRFAEYQPEMTLDDGDHPLLQSQAAAPPTNPPGTPSSSFLAASSSSGPFSVASSSLALPQEAPPPLPLEFARASSFVTATSTSCTNSHSDYLLGDEEGVDNAILQSILEMSKQGAKALVPSHDAPPAKGAFPSAVSMSTTGGSVLRPTDQGEGEEEEEEYQRLLFESLQGQDAQAQDVEVAEFAAQMEKAIAASLESASNSLEKATLAERERWQAQLVDDDLKKSFTQAEEEQNPDKRQAKMRLVTARGTEEMQRRQAAAKDRKLQAWAVDKDLKVTVKVPKEKRDSLQLFRGTEGQYLEHMRVSEKLDMSIAEDNSAIDIRLPKAVLFGTPMTAEAQETLLDWGKGLAEGFLQNPQASLVSRLNQDHRVHVFIDWSNIFLSAKAEGREVNVARFAALIEQDQHVLTRVVATSAHYQLKSAAAVLESKGYKKAIEPAGKEVFVDGSLQLQLMDIANKEWKDNTKHTIRLATGDGNQLGADGKVDEEMMSFPKCVLAVLRKGYKVEIWTWRHSCSRKYHEIRRAYEGEGRLSIVLLDTFRDFLCPAVSFDEAEFPAVNGTGLAWGIGNQGGTPGRDGSNSGATSSQSGPSTAHFGHDDGLNRGRGRGRGAGAERGRGPPPNGRFGRRGRR